MTTIVNATPRLDETRINITKLTFMAQGSFHPEYVRPYAAVATAENMAALCAFAQEKNEVIRMEINDGVRNPHSSEDIVSPQEMAKYNIFKSSVPLATATNRKVEIDATYSFAMEMEFKHEWQSNKKFIVNGFTKDNPFKEDGSLNERAELRINSIQEAVAFVEHTEDGPQGEYKLVGDMKVLNDDQYQHPGGDCLERTTPADMFAKLSIKHDPFLNDPSITIVDSRVGLNTSAHLSSISHGSPAHFMADFINSLYLARRIASVDTGHVRGPVTLLENANRHARGPSARRHAVMKTFEEVRGEGFPTPYIDIQSLLRIDPLIATTVMRIDRENPHLDLKNIQNWEGEDLITSVAYRICQTLPVIMSDNRVQTIGFEYSTSDQEMLSLYKLVPASFGNSAAKAMDAVQSDLLDLLLRPIAMNDQINGVISVQAEANDVFVVTVALKDQEPVTYRHAAFASSLVSPTIMRKEDADRLAEPFSTLFDDMLEHNPL